MSTLTSVFTRAAQTALDQLGTDTIQYVAHSVGTYNEDTMEQVFTPVSTAFVGAFVMNKPQAVIPGTSVEKRGDATVYADGEVSFTPTTKGVVGYAGDRWRVVDVLAHRSGDTVVLWEMQVKHSG